MSVKFAYAVAIYLLCCLPFSVALGCAYTVRDVGFVDIKPASYHLYCYTRDDTPEDFISAFRQISCAALMDSNVKVEMINVDQRKSMTNPEANTAYEQAVKYSDLWELKSFPAAILVSPKGQSLALPLSVPGKPLKETLWSAMEGIVSSPKREEILSSIAEAYCVVLLIQGPDAAENRKTQAVISDAIKEVETIMAQMPKSIEEPPRLVVIPPQLSSQERILLWSLGVSESEVDGPYAALLYGRGRRIGPLLKGEEITLNRLFDVLFVIGSSCECGLDRGWVLGTMIPLRWDEKMQSEVVEHLAFDAESPMVKTEISQILSLGPSLGADKPSQSGKLVDYSEQIVEFENRPIVATVSPAQFRQLAAPVSTASGVVDRPYQKALFIIGGMILLILGSGVFIILRARRRTS